LTNIIISLAEVKICRPSKPKSPLKVPKPSHYIPGKCKAASHNKCEINHCMDIYAEGQKREKQKGRCRTRWAG